MGKTIEKTVENDDKENSAKTDFREEILWILLGTFRGLLDDRKVITVCRSIRVFAEVQNYIKDPLNYS